MALFAAACDRWCCRLAIQHVLQLLCVLQLSPAPWCFCYLVVSMHFCFNLCASPTEGHTAAKPRVRVRVRVIFSGATQRRMAATSRSQVLTALRQALAVATLRAQHVDLRTCILPSHGATARCWS
eukprot:TRINITY_DN29105_c0_g1_i1.p1 TRINITY_DN29105_c0_g1~~TRINITY_DN29105_c0_g1_i1.p1  ORF type:complete len:125 (-),score=14.68 TRINITY_DN29105_c0_g1_i1:310-684(-)